jgi:hypothetical protein
MLLHHQDLLLLLWLNLRMELLLTLLAGHDDPLGSGLLRHDLHGPHLLLRLLWQHHSLSRLKLPWLDLADGNGLPDETTLLLLLHGNLLLRHHHARLLWLHRRLLLLRLHAHLTWAQSCKTRFCQFYTFV